MFQLKTILNTYGTKIKYALRVVFFVAMIFAIRTYVNYMSQDTCVCYGNVNDAATLRFVTHGFSYKSITS